MPDSDFFEQIKLFLPKYLTPDQKHTLFSELSAFPNNQSFYLSNPKWQKELLQGDGWRGFVALNFMTGERKTVSGVVVSNSCDIDSANVRTLAVNVLFSPLIALSRYEAELRDAGKNAQQIAQIFDAIRTQRTTSIFYLPALADVLPESIILLDNIHAQPLEHFLANDRACLFTLNQFAFYLFLIKLSIHFSRFQENVGRFDSAA
jgi:hypothetical protein